MIGLLVKDLTILKKQLKITILVLIFYAIWSVYEQNTTMFAYMSILFGFFIPITAINYDERAQWNKYALCMPIKKSGIATSKYILGLLGCSVGVIGYYILTLCISAGLSVEQLKIGVAMLSGGMVFSSLYLPFCFKFGAERARYFIIALGLIPTVLIIILSKANINIDPSKDILHLLLNIAPLIALIIGAVSWMLSVHIINHKEY